MIRADGETANVRLVSGFERPSIERLLQFYIYDFSELETPDSDDLEFDDQDSYAPFPGLESYWCVDGFRPLLIRVKERLAGFVLINTRSHRSGRVDYNVAEFFVARKYRRCGVATEAVCQVLAQYPGHWEIAVAERNVAARAFWFNLRATASIGAAASGVFARLSMPSLARPRVNTFSDRPLLAQGRHSFRPDRNPPGLGWSLYCGATRCLDLAANWISASEASEDFRCGSARRTSAMLHP